MKVHSFEHLSFSEEGRLTFEAYCLLCPLAVIKPMKVNSLFSLR